MTPIDNMPVFKSVKHYFTMHLQCFSLKKETKKGSQASKKSAFITRTTNGNLWLIGDALLTDMFPHP